MSLKKPVKYLAKTFYVTLGVFTFVYLFFYTLDTFYISSISKENINAFNKGIDTDLQYLKEKGDEVAQSQLVIESLLKKDSRALIMYLRAEREHRGIGLMGVADKNGIIIGRTKSTNKLGDNAFLTNPIGRFVAEGIPAQSVEAPIGFDPRQIFLTTGRPIFFEDKMIGALFSNYLTDDIYARRFKYTYMPKGTEVVFYNKKGGVYGVSFADYEFSDYIRAYFKVDSPWLQDGLSDKYLSFENKTYLIQNIVFPGLEESPGGVLLFLSPKDTSSTTRGVVVFITLLVFSFFIFRYYKYPTDDIDIKWWHALCFVLVGALVSTIMFFVLQIQKKDVFQITSAADHLFMRIIDR